MLVFPIIIIISALFFEFINGFHDTANAVATSIATRSLEPFQAIALSSVFNLLGVFSGTAVAITIAQGFVNPALATNAVVFAAVLSAIAWNLTTWALGIPSSSSHALIGGLVGAVIYKFGYHHVKYKAVILKVILPMVLSPVLGFIIAAIIVIILHRIFMNYKEPKRLNNYIREVQVVSSAFLSFSHGSNDAQKTMGIITLTLFHAHLIDSTTVPLWVIIMCAICMALGTLSGGMRIIKTLSTRVAKLKPINGFAAEITSAMLLFSGSRLGLPLSTTHAVSGSIMGTGAVTGNRFGVNWGIVKNMVIAWLLTLPCCAILAGIFVHII